MKQSDSHSKIFVISVKEKNQNVPWYEIKSDGAVFNGTSEYLFRDLKLTNQLCDLILTILQKEVNFNHQQHKKQQL